MFQNLILFQSTHRVWGGTSWQRRRIFTNPPFLLHPPRVGWDEELDAESGRAVRISIHPPRCGVGPGESYEVAGTGRNFNPPTPCGVGRVSGSEDPHSSRFQIPPHPVWGGTTTVTLLYQFVCISIHPPRVGLGNRDSRNLEPTNMHHFKSHPPRVGWDDTEVTISASPDEFQCHPPGAGGDEFPFNLYGFIQLNGGFATHPRRVGWDSGCSSRIFKRQAFGSTHPVRGGTWNVWPTKKLETISDCHPPVWAGPVRQNAFLHGVAISIRPHPCGVGACCLAPTLTVVLAFQSTHPVWGGTWRAPCQWIRATYFNPPTPCGVGHRAQR